MKRSNELPGAGAHQGSWETLRAVSRHVERYIGPIDVVFHEHESRVVHVDVQQVPPSKRRPFHTLVTSGMSDLPMEATPEAEERARAELFLLLPPDWPVFPLAVRKERWGWPVRLLRDLAHFPHDTSTWIGCGHTIQNEDPPIPYGPGTQFCASLLTHPVTAGIGFSQAEIFGRSVDFLQVVPLFEEELRFAERHSSNALLARFAQYGMSDVVDPSRRNVCRLDVH